MAFTSEQLTRGADYALKARSLQTPIDQINIKHVALDWLIKNKVNTLFTGGSFKQPLYISNGSNFQRYFGADQVTFNQRDPARWTDFAWYDVHEGFWLDEDTLLMNGIRISDDSSSAPTVDEKNQLINLLNVNYDAVQRSMQENLAYDLYRNGSTSNSCPGLLHVIQKVPTSWAADGNTVGGIASATTAYWRNNYNTGITGSGIVAAMETTYQDCMLYGGKLPSKIVGGRAFVDNYRTYAQVAVNRQVNDGGNAKGGGSIDPSMANLYFHGIPVEWDPTLDALGTADSDATLTKTAFFLNDAVKLRPVTGEWMKERKPVRTPDRYVHYFGRTAKFGLTCEQRNALAVLSIS